MRISSFTGQQRSIALPPYKVAALASGRLRALAVPLSTNGAIRTGDALWVREGIWVNERQRQKGELEFSYAGESRTNHVAWPRALAKPGSGHRPPEAMPPQASRFTLLVERVEHMRLVQVEDDDALAAGVTMDGPGYGCLGYPFMEPFQRAVEALQFLYSQENRQQEWVNPEVALITFRAHARNIAMLLSGGGA